MCSRWCRRVRPYPRLRRTQYDLPVQSSGHFKDSILDELARTANVAQFVSFGPGLGQRHAWVRGYAPNHRFPSPAAAVEALLAASPERSLNIRSYEPQDAKSREFLYGRTEAGLILEQLQALGGQGRYTILNETIDIEDGGVSGVALGDVLELAPGDTPRCVEKPGTASFPRETGLRLLETVYRFRPALPARTELRAEFSLHPRRRGFRHEHTILWEVEEPGMPAPRAEITWPNRFSRHLGDKAFGLLVAHTLGLPVPRTEVVPRRLAPFTFGEDTGLAETWIRTCPFEQVPGFFTTRRGWIDPFRLLQEEDPTGEAIASILCQQAVEPAHSGALVTQPGGEPWIEGVAGPGDEFMAGRRPPEALPERVAADILGLFERTRGLLGSVRFEWVHDGARAWILQLHRGTGPASGRSIVPGEAPVFHPFPVGDGIEALRALIDRVQGTGEGIELIGRVGVTSHFGDLLRRARIPSRIIEPPA